ncbi:hypothetical protein [Wolbachia endosymbiont of Dirofilaria (Dirofilaria) immitis]|nr:hypothetical protein [Wolbachia endosymbiont of Dirofilaria (Dirofilaria) immitis]QKX02148.1 hypothetical protein GOY12_00955 [Wolbachia endosymbiont of Dirofilaria (Dirofilaria) immitis]
MSSLSHEMIIIINKLNSSVNKEDPASKLVFDLIKAGFIVVSGFTRE